MRRFTEHRRGEEAILITNFVLFVWLCHMQPTTAGKIFPLSLSPYKLLAVVFIHTLARLLFFHQRKYWPTASVWPVTSPIWVRIKCLLCVSFSLSSLFLSFTLRCHFTCFAGVKRGEKKIYKHSTWAQWICIIADIYSQHEFFFFSLQVYIPSLWNT